MLAFGLFNNIFSIKKLIVCSIPVAQTAFKSIQYFIRILSSKGNIDCNNILASTFSLKLLNMSGKLITGSLTI